MRDNVISDNLRSGVWSWNGPGLRILDNRIERNGASGIFLGPEVHTADVFSNTIAGHPDMGVAVALGAEVIQIRRNALSNNRGLGIDWGLDKADTPQISAAGSRKVWRGCEEVA